LVATGDDGSLGRRRDVLNRRLLLGGRGRVLGGRGGVLRSVDSWGRNPDGGLLGRRRVGGSLNDRRDVDRGVSRGRRLGDESGLGVLNLRGNGGGLDGRVVHRGGGGLGRDVGLGGRGLRLLRGDDRDGADGGGLNLGDGGVGGALTRAVLNLRRASDDGAGLSAGQGALAPGVRGLLGVVRLARVNPVPAVILIVVALVHVYAVVRRVVHVGALIARAGRRLAAEAGKEINVDAEGQVDVNASEEGEALSGSHEGEGGKSLSLHCCLLFVSLVV